MTILKVLPLRFYADYVFNKKGLAA